MISADNPLFETKAVPWCKVLQFCMEKNMALHGSRTSLCECSQSIYCGHVFRD